MSWKSSKKLCIFVCWNWWETVWSHLKCRPWWASGLVQSIWLDTRIVPFKGELGNGTRHVSNCYPHFFGTNHWGYSQDTAKISWLFDFLPFQIFLLIHNCACPDGCRPGDDQDSDKNQDPTTDDPASCKLPVFCSEIQYVGSRTILTRSISPHESLKMRECIPHTCPI